MKGYRKIALFMSEHPDDTAIFRRFHALNLQNLLYRQAEIIGLEQDLRAIEGRNEASLDRDIAGFSLDWWSLANLHDTPGSEKQWLKFQELSQKLTEYNAAVIQYLQLSHLPDPRPKTVAKFKEWLSSPRFGDVHLIGRDSDCWDRENDLMLLHAVYEKNRFAKIIVDLIIPIFLRVRHSKLVEKVFKDKDTSLPNNSNPPPPSSQPATEAGRIKDFSAAVILTAADFIGTICACLLPVVSIVVLYLVKSMVVRLGLVALFSAVFSTCMWFLSDGGLVGIFAATSGFAAVQVVFIGSTDQAIKGD